MSGVTLTQRGFRLGGRPFFLYGGEIHYFRIPASAWRSRLRQAKAVGLNTVGCYLPWIGHERQEGAIDLRGRTGAQRNLERWLRLISDAGLYCFARVGPVCNGELANEGIPPWVLARYPEVRLLRRDGTPHPYPPLISYLHPTFQRLVGRWHERLFALLRRYQYPRGPVILVQLDNEISMLNWLTKSPDYHGHVTTRYQAFLKARYRRIEPLNQAYQTAYRRFDEVEQPRGDVEREGLRRSWDWAAFYRHYYATYFATLTAHLRRTGIRLPVMANIPQFYDYQQCGRAVPGLMTSSMFREFSRQVPGTIFGGAYQLRRCDFENFHDLYLMDEAARAIADPRAPAICAEFQTGGINDRPRIYSSDVALNFNVSVGHGLNGVNCYMFAAGHNTPGLGCRGSYHEWQAPVASDGTERPHIAPLKEIGAFLARHGTALARSRVCYDDGALGWIPGYYPTEYLSGAYPAQLTTWRDRLFFDGLARLTVLAGYTLPLIDLERATLAQLLRHRHLLVFSLPQMPHGVQLLLASYVRRGGRLLLMPAVPTQDLWQQPDTTLQRSLGIRQVRAVAPSFAWVGLPRPPSPVGSARRGRRDALVEELQFVVRAPGAKIIARTPSGEPCGIVRRVGRGRVVVAGFGMPHLYDYHVEVMRTLCETLGLTPQVRVTPWDVHAVVRMTGRQGFLFLSNLNDEPRRVAVDLPRPGTRGGLRVPAQGVLPMPGRSARILPIG
ncbi:MAG: beta-galactosidase [Candidatus Omnitrophica bacterium]|nr:beta-galactosidase [Candidatus Omnitrophota bacterium]